jgi:SAM-dependent methyltransferase
VTDFPKVRPTDPPPNLQVRLGNNLGGTSISQQRRAFDARFATRWFVGVGLDVGGGGDSLGLYTELFPGIRKVLLYDKEHGDAGKLDNVDDDSFDFLYSSHCLEHLSDPFEALSNWIRIVKRNGHCIVSVPDEDLYEQGIWPSQFNSDHKVSFTIDKESSWSPVSVNILDLLRSVRSSVRILRIETIDHAYRYRLPSEVGVIDQTRTPTTESAIEFVLRKL